jgi:Domain of unknown function (DUF4326)
MTTSIVHINHSPFDIYIGRTPNKNHFGNPFSHIKTKTLATAVVQTRRDSIMAFKQWLDGTAYRHIEPLRRIWILEHLEDLRDKTLGCYCKPKQCHGDVYIELLDRPKGLFN